MIDGAQQFHFLGRSRRGRGHILVFTEGVLIFDTALPGWGAMRPSDLALLMGPGPAPQDLLDLLVPPLPHSQADSAESPRSSSASGSPSPRVKTAPASTVASASSDAADWAPDTALLGWQPWRRSAPWRQRPAWSPADTWSVPKTTASACWSSIGACWCSATPMRP